MRGNFVGWLAKGGGHGARRWQAVCSAASEAEAAEAVEKIRHSKWPWAGYTCCTWVVLRHGEHPANALKRQSSTSPRRGG
jgi:hypothetical protein